MTKPTQGHKCAGVRVGYQATCECGWQSGWIFGGKFGSGGRPGAYTEWRSHVSQCKTVALISTGMSHQEAQAVLFDQSHHNCRDATKIINAALTAHEPA